MSNESARPETGGILTRTVRDLMVGLFAPQVIFMVVVESVRRATGEPMNAFVALGLTLLLTFALIRWRRSRQMQTFIAEESYLLPAKLQFGRKDLQTVHDLETVGFVSRSPRALMVGKRTFSTVIPLKKLEENTVGFWQPSNLQFFSKLSDGRWLTTSDASEVQHPDLLVVRHERKDPMGQAGAHSAALRQLSLRGISAVPATPTEAMTRLTDFERQILKEHIAGGGKSKTIPRAKETSPELLAVPPVAVAA